MSRTCYFTHHHPNNPLTITSPYQLTKRNIPSQPRNPLDPQYSLPSYEIKVDPPPSFIRSTLDVSDIEKTQPFNIYNQRIGNITNYVYDIKGAYKLPVGERRIGQLEKEAEESGREEQEKKKQRNTDPLDPIYRIGTHKSQLSLSTLLQNLNLKESDRIHSHYQHCKDQQQQVLNDSSNEIGPVNGSHTRTQPKFYSQLHSHSLRTFDPPPSPPPPHSPPIHNRILLVSDIEGTTAGSRKSKFRTGRCTNPLHPEYSLPIGVNRVDRIGEKLNLKEKEKNNSFSQEKEEEYKTMGKGLKSVTSTIVLPITRQFALPETISPATTVPVYINLQVAEKEIHCNKPNISFTFDSTASTESSTSPSSSNSTSSSTSSNLSETITSASNSLSSLTASTGSVNWNPSKFSTSPTETVIIPSSPLPLSSFFHAPNPKPTILAPPQTFASSPQFSISSHTKNLPPSLPLPIHPNKLSFKFGLDIPTFVRKEYASVGGYGPTCGNAAVANGIRLTNEKGNSVDNSLTNKEKLKQIKCKIDCHRNDAPPSRKQKINEKLFSDPAELRQRQIDIASVRDLN